MNNLKIEPIEIANFLVNIPKDLREWLISDKNLSMALIHNMRCWSDNKLRVQNLYRVKNMDEAEFSQYFSIISIPDDVFTNFIKSLAVKNN